MKPASGVSLPVARSSPITALFLTYLPVTLPSFTAFKGDERVKRVERRGGGGGKNVVVGGNASISITENMLDKMSRLSGKGVIRAMIGVRCCTFTSV